MTAERAEEILRDTASHLRNLYGSSTIPIMLGEAPANPPVFVDDVETAIDTLTA